MEHQYIKDLQNLTLYINITLNHLKWWLIKYEEIIPKKIEKSVCKKWNKWYYYNAKPFPCVCPTREDGCLFLEIYYEFQKLVELSEKEEFFENAIKEHKQLDGSKEKIIKWVAKYKSIGGELFFSIKLNFKIQAAPYESLVVNLNTDDFKNIIEFQGIFDKEYFSKD